jgi:AcrR family transcriptional regulator
LRTKSPELPERMLEAAAKLFGRQRFHEVRMDDIALEAEVGKGTLYRYFSDKDELYLALLERAARQVTDRLRTNMALAAGPEAKLEAVVGTVLGFFDEQPHVFDLIQRAEMLRGFNMPWQSARDEITRIVTGVFAEAKASGRFAVADPEMSALMLMGGMRAVTRFGQRPRPADLVRRIVQTFLDGAGRRYHASN